MRNPNAQYSLAASQIAGRMRRKMLACFLAETAVRAEHTILDVGATSDETYDHSNYLEASHPRKERIIAVGIDNAAILERPYPGLRFVKADGCMLPFHDDAFDFVHSSAVIEHVGGAVRQCHFLRELFRVCRIAMCITTPNRWFPIEVHTMLPLVHWLPKLMFRTLLSNGAYSFFPRRRI